jgi:hypothetical protein
MTAMPSKSYVGTVPAGGNANRASDPPGEETVSAILEIGLPPSKEVAGNRELADPFKPFICWQRPLGK